MPDQLQPVTYKLKYVGGPTIDSVRYLHVKDNLNDYYFYDETIDEIESYIFTSDGAVQDIVIESVPLFAVIFTSEKDINSVNGHLSTFRDNWVKNGFSFGTYYGESPVFNVRLGGTFHSRDNNFHTLNYIFSDFPKISTWSKTIFRDYVDGTDGTSEIVGLKCTFKNNTILSELPVGQLQYLPYLESIRECWMNTNISELKSGVFGYQTNMMDTYGAFENTPMGTIPSRLIAIG